jgi:hypothetical protein
MQDEPFRFFNFNICPAGTETFHHNPLLCLYTRPVELLHKNGDVFHGCDHVHYSESEGRGWGPPVGDGLQIRLRPAGIYNISKTNMLIRLELR